MLNGRRPSGRLHVQVLAMLRGEEPLPWEGPSGEAAVAKLGVLKGPLMALLQREPAQRASMRRFHVACTRVFAARSTMEASAPPPLPHCMPSMPQQCRSLRLQGSGCGVCWLDRRCGSGRSAFRVWPHSAAIGVDGPVAWGALTSESRFG